MTAAPNRRGTNPRGIVLKATLRAELAALHGLYESAMTQVTVWSNRCYAAETNAAHFKAETDRLAAELGSPRRIFFAGLLCGAGLALLVWMVGA